MILKNLLHRCFSDAHVGIEVCAWISILINAFWICVTAMCWGAYAILLAFHAIIGVILGADLKQASRKEHIKRYGTFLVVNGIFIAFEVVLLISLIVGCALRAYENEREEWHMRSPYPPFLPGSAHGIIYMLVATALNVTIEFYVRAAYKRAGAPTRSLSPVSGA